MWVQPAVLLLLPPLPDLLLDTIDVHTHSQFLFFLYFICSLTSLLIGLVTDNIGARAFLPFSFSSPQARERAKGHAIKPYDGKEVGQNLTERREKFSLPPYPFLFVVFPHSSC